MKKQIMILALATGMVANGFGQQTITIGGAINGTPQTVPASISQFEASGGLITQNSFSFLPFGDPRITGNFGTTARWNSMGNLNFNSTNPSLSQTLNGFRTQTNGRGLAWGHSIPTSTGIVSNSFIEWIENTNAGVPLGNLDFRFAINPGSGSSLPASTVFSLQPAGIPTNQEANVLATNKSILGHLQAGNFGNISGNARWIGIGAARIGGVLNDNNYGLRVQRDGNSYIANLTNNGEAITGWGPGNDMFHRFFNSNTNPNDFINVVKYRPNGCIEMGDNITAYSFDPKLRINSQPFRTALAIETNAGAGIEMLVKDRTGIDIQVQKGIDNQGFAFGVNSNVTGGEFANFGIATFASDVDSYGILATASPSSGKFGAAGYFNGAVFSTGGFFNISDKKFKKDISLEEGVLTKINKLKPVTYLFKVDEFKQYSFDQNFQHGFIADELESVFPEMIKKTKNQ